MGTTSQRAEDVVCRACGYANPPLARICSLCSEFLDAPGSEAVAAGQPPQVGARPPIAEAAGAAPFLRRSTYPGTAISPAESMTRLGSWPVLGIGAVLAPVFLLTPMLQYMGWFLASLIHELGHCIVAWTFGSFAFPAIRLDGHAAAVHQPQSVPVVVLILAGLVYLLYMFRAHARARVLLGAAVLLYPVLAFTEAHEVVHLLGGHLAELAFAGVFFFRGLSGGFTDSTPERITYATCAWYLLARNLDLTFGLMSSAADRAAYATSGSFGLTNDFIRVGRELGWTLPGVARLMFLLALCVLPLAIWAWHASRKPVAA